MRAPSGEIAEVTSIHRSVFARLLVTGVVLVPFMLMGTGEGRAESVFVEGANGENRADLVNPGDWAPGGTGGPATANASSVDPLNKATRSVEMAETVEMVEMGPSTPIPAATAELAAL